MYYYLYAQYFLTVSIKPYFMKKLTFLKSTLFITVIFCLIPIIGVSQSDFKYQTPPQEMVDIVNAPVMPTITMSPHNDRLVILSRPSNPSIEDVSREELRIGGLRIDPKTNGPSRFSYFTGIVVKDVETLKESAIQGLPANLKATSVRWSPDGNYISFLSTETAGISLWIIDVATLQAKVVSKTNINGIFRGSICTWMPDSKSIVFSGFPANRAEAPEKSGTPSGPVVQETMGEVSVIRTYQDLLKTPYDEQLFSFFGTSQLYKYEIGGEVSKFGNDGIIISVNPSPDGNYVMVQTVTPPFSYLVPYYRFPMSVEIWSKEGSVVKTLAKIPLMESIPQGFDAAQPGPRRFTWRSDAPASVYWVEALDEGNPKKEVEFRDQIYYLEAPFSNDASKGPATQYRYRGISWGNDDIAILNEGWRKTRKTLVSMMDPDDSSKGLKKVFEYSSEDRYKNPGYFASVQNEAGKYVLQFGNKGKSLYLSGQGASPEGNRPFVDEFDIKSFKVKRLFRSEAPYYESPYEIIDLKRNLLLTSRQSVSEPPNYFIRNLKSDKLIQITEFQHPYPQFKDIKKEVVKYEREDGVQLSFDLYLPAGYKKEDGPLPSVLWAYPREYKSAAAAGQVSGSPYTFTRLSAMSALVMATQGYAVLNNTSFPIIGEGDEEPNDSFVKQLVANAEAAIDKASEMGVTDPKRVGVGGHSYGAFMTANLLAHTDLFAAGIARSGAYNRTLTPFGFQAEPRTYWEAPEIYYVMSPFMHADELKEPILLIHGIADNNSGTFPIQSERFYSALKGNGGTARLVMLPNESHGYRAQESLLHMLWEMNTWFEKYVKNKK